MLHLITCFLQNQHIQRIGDPFIEDARYNGGEGIISGNLLAPHCV